ncbi:zinc finger CCCH domain-containing protein 20-like [Salvia miltiorrhiza]|uniref:zinc finger CCCH domain-containing protein 20-like n=1 Tax=Salvia miltiorrhiza TaxID=226208 RepID=UPI0025ACE4F7|nr:zinc finger CCCH domain-containing protein 20-like [Salvia miltiorrhiza]
MMMTGDHPRSNPTVKIPSWDYGEEPTAHIQSPISGALSSQYDAALAALQRYLPGNRDDDGVPGFDDSGDAFSCDDFRMFEFKVRRCAIARSHDWTDCPFAHPGEKARRRDPRRHHYSGGACPDFRRAGDCARGDACEYAHGVFESWLHPARYRTQPCKDGTGCRRRVCFFAHTPEQLRVLPPLTTSPDASPIGVSPRSAAMYSPPPSSPTAGSPPISPSMSLSSVTESMRCLQLSKMKMGMKLSMSPPSWGIGLGLGPGSGSPRSPRPGFMSLPTTPIQSQTRSGLSAFDAWGGGGCEEEPVMERVESGRQLRERIYAKLVRENSLDRGRANSASSDYG